jgi:signal transduction histidine kinase
MGDKNNPMIDQDHLREMIEVISGELELRPLLTTIVQKACELLRADRGSIGLVDTKQDLVRIEAVYKMPPEELGSISRSGQGLAGAVFRDRKAMLVGRYGDVPARSLEDMDEDSVIGMPIMWRGEIIGTFGIGASPPKRFGDNDLASLEVFARHAAIAINNARSYQREKKYAALKERQRLARDLHDNVSQLIFSMSLVAQSIGPGFAKSNAEGEARIARLLDITGLAQTEMKALLAELRSLSDDEPGSMAAYARQAGLAAALRRHASIAAPETSNVFVNAHDDDALSPEQRETLLRIAQEAMANAFRHGGAKNVEFSLVESPKRVNFSICDDGAGLDAETQGGAAHMGLASMKTRAKSAGGELSIKNRPNGGVCVEVDLPVA